jgi:hypothetical protein
MPGSGTLLAYGRTGRRKIHFAPISPTIRNQSMSKLLRGLAAGYGAKKLGGGCITTVLIFIVLWMILGNFEIFR